MATYTPNYNLSKPDATDDFDAFRASYGDNMDKIDNNMGGGGGGGGHTIVDPDGTDMPQENKLQFTGAVNVSDDSANGQTVVNVEGGGNVYGAFIDPTRVVYSSFVFDSSAHTWTATEDCILTDNMLPPDSTTAYFIRIGGKQVFAGYSTVEDPFVYVKKGQVVEYRAKSGSSLKAYGVTQGTNGIFAPVIYSDTERAIGVWRDGKPLYQKTIDFGTLPNQTTKSIAHGISDIDASCIVSIEPIASTSSYATVPRVHDTNVSTQVFWEVNSTNIICYSRNANNTAFTHCFVTLKYTKTTDTAGSGSWTPSGANAVHYSTNEQVIGTWIDGKPLYEKTFNFTGTYSGDQGSVPINMSIADTIFPVEAWGINSGNAICPFPYVHSSANNNGGFFISVDKKSIGLRFASGLTFKKVVITLRYTKTTD